MILLGLDASTPKGSVALLRDRQIIAESTGSSTFSDQLLVLMDEVLGSLDGGLEKLMGFALQRALGLLPDSELGSA